MREMNNLINLTVKLSKKIITVFCLCLLIFFLMISDLYLSGNKNIAVGQLGQRIEYINKLGVSADQASEQISEIFVPNDFSEAFEAFNKELKSQGFDLTKLKGETIKRYAYKTNSGEEVSLFVYNNILIGYDIRED